MNASTYRARQAGLFSLFFLFAFLTACSATGQNQAVSVPAAPPDVYTEDASPAMAGELGPGGGSESLSPSPTLEGRKISLTAYLTLEALDFDATCTQLQESIAGDGGYLSGTDISGDNASGSRYAMFTAKIPAEKYPDFLSSASEAGNLTSRSETTEDVTATYVDVEARLKSLRAQEEQLLKMMGSASELSDLILIQEQLADIQYQIESYVMQQRNLDSLIDYSTVYISVYEVSHFTEQQQDYGSRVAAAFQEGWRAAGIGIQALGLWLVRLFPLILLSGTALVVVLVIRRHANKKRAKSPPASPPYPSGETLSSPSPYSGAPYSPYPPYPVPLVGPAALENEETPPPAQQPPPGP